MIRRPSFVFLLCLAACGDDDAPVTIDASVAAPDAAGLDAGGRPQNVQLCYTELSSTHVATTAFWSAIRAGDLDARASVIASLKAAAEMHPMEEEFALLHGLANLWRVAEPLPSEVNDQNGFITAAIAARTELERAYALCPTDHRIPAWLGPILVNTGRATNDQATIDEGMTVLQQGIDNYPAFVLFSKLLVFADRPKADPDFQMALAAIEANVMACGAADPACTNHAHAAHNIEGAMVFMGDVYAKDGQKSVALGWYGDAMDAAEYADWDYQALLQDRVATIDARIAAFDTVDTADDPISAWTDTNQCSICHRQ